MSWRHNFLNSVCCTHQEQSLGFSKQVSNILVVRDKASLAWENYFHLGKIFRRYFSKHEASGSLLSEKGNSCSSATRVLYKCQNADSLKTESDASIKATVCAISTEVKVRTEGPADTLRS